MPLRPTALSTMAGLDNRRPRSQGQNGHGEKKRKHEAEAYDGMRHTLSLRRQQSELEEFNLTSSRRPGQDEGSNKEDEAEDLHSADDWQTVENGRPKKKSKKIPKPNSSNVSIRHAECFLHGLKKILLKCLPFTVPCNQVFDRFETPIADQDQ